MSTDSDVIARSIAEPAAFGELFHRHAPRVHRYVARRAGETIADDVTSETFLTAFERRDRFDHSHEEARPWLLGIATNLIHRHRVAEARTFRLLERAAREEVTDGGLELAGEALDLRQEVQRLSRELRKLKLADRDCLLLFAWEDLSYEPERGRPSFRTTRWILTAAAAAAVVTLVAGNLNMTAQSAHAVTALQQLAGVTITYSDPVPGPGQYLLAETHANWFMTEIDDTTGTVTRTPNDQIIQVYKPADPTVDWVLYRDWGDWHAITADGHIEVIAAQDGAFYGGPWVTQDISEIPEGTGAQVLAYFDAQYIGGSASRDEDNFGRITSLLRSGLVPAEVRARLYEALALIPGVTAASDVANLDGVEGIAIGRIEWLRGGERQEIIVDPDTGLVIGERAISTVALFGWGFNEVMWSTAITTSVAATAP